MLSAPAAAAQAAVTDWHVLGCQCHGLCRRHHGKTAGGLAEGVTCDMSSWLFFSRSSLSSPLSSSSRVKASGSLSLCPGWAHAEGCPGCSPQPGWRCRAAVYYSGQVRLQHHIGFAAPRQPLPPSRSITAPSSSSHSSLWVQRVCVLHHCHSLSLAPLVLLGDVLWEVMQHDGSSGGPRQSGFCLVLSGLHFPALHATGTLREQFFLPSSWGLWK